MKTTRNFYANRERYHYDFNQCRFDDGWAQIDTADDASYYGQWANPKTLEILAFVEGDEIHHQCETLKEFAQQLQSVKDFHAEGYKGADPGTREELIAPWRVPELIGFLHRGKVLVV